MDAQTAAWEKELIDNKKRNTIGFTTSTEATADEFSKQLHWMDNILYQRENITEACAMLGVENPEVAYQRNAVLEQSTSLSFLNRDFRPLLNLLV